MLYDFLTTMECITRVFCPPLPRPVVAYWDISGEKPTFSVVFSGQRPIGFNFITFGWTEKQALDSGKWFGLLSGLRVQSLTVAEAGAGSISCLPPPPLDFQRLWRHLTRSDNPAGPT